MQLFYHPSLIPDSQEVTFDKTESRHLVRVLRKKEGDLVSITNGAGYLFTGRIKTANDKKCTVEITTVEARQKNRAYSLHIAIAPTKLNDRFEWFLEKATEIGIDQITPIVCEHSERKVLKIERMEKILQAAAKQSLHCHFPILNPAISFKDFIQQDLKGLLCIAHCEERDKQALKTVLKPGQNTTILIGPEGDFSKGEITQALAHQFIPVSLGESRLRTETAGVVAVHSTAFINQL